MAKVLFENIVGEEVVCKHFKDFTEVEQRYLETLVEEAIIQKGINVPLMNQLMSISVSKEFHRESGANDELE